MVPPSCSVDGRLRVGGGSFSRSLIFWSWREHLISNYNPRPLGKTRLTKGYIRLVPAVRNPGYLTVNAGDCHLEILKPQYEPVVAGVVVCETLTRLLRPERLDTVISRDQRRRQGQRECDPEDRWPRLREQGGTLDTLPEGWDVSFGLMPTTRSGRLKGATLRPSEFHIAGPRRGERVQEITWPRPRKPFWAVRRGLSGLWRSFSGYTSASRSMLRCAASRQGRVWKRSSESGGAFVGVAVVLPRETLVKEVVELVPLPERGKGR
ncbi:hypothetical protein B0H10DRAFT_2198126 [Mycena sp. CBHHK59/15]|nr:hypothetical protein B0H10DRAFT_2198126 [Mycena sp. CBHHK59/15]